jgi:hypothetical protein
VHHGCKDKQFSTENENNSLIMLRAIPMMRVTEMGTGWRDGTSLVERGIASVKQPPTVPCDLANRVNRVKR